MRHTVSERRKKWFFLRSMFRAFWEHLDKHNGQRRSKSVSRPLFAEALEARVLFSAAPVPVEPDQEPVDEAPVAQEAGMPVAPPALLGGGPTPTTEVTVDGSGNLNITDTDGGNTNDNLTLKLDGANFNITDTGNGINQNVPAGTVGGAITVNGGGGDDTLTIDLSGGTITNNIIFNGGAGGFDTLVVTGGAFGTVTYNATNAFDGVLNFGTFTVTFTGLEPVDMTGSTVVDYVINVDPSNLVAGGHTTTIEQVGGTDTRVSITGGFEHVLFRTLTGTLTINGEAGEADTITLTGVGTGFAGGLTINGGTGNDTVNLNGDVTFAAGKSLAVTAEAVNTGAGADLVTSGAGSVTLTADDVAIDATSTLVSAATVTLVQQTAGRQITLGMANPGQLNLSDIELDRITAGTVQIGDSNSGLVTVNDAITHANDLSITTGAGLTVGNAITMAVDKDLTVSAIGTINLSSINSDIAATGTGTISLTTVRNIALASGASVTTVDGSLSLSANQQTTATSGNFSGVEVNDGLIQATGTGTVSVLGRGGSGAGGLQRGVYVYSGGDIIGGTAGQLTVRGTGGASSGNSNDGVGIFNGSTITSSGGAVLVDGTGGGVGASTSSRGVTVASAGAITNAGTGSGATVTVRGVGGNTSGTGGINQGVAVSSTISSSGGAVLVEGTGGGAGSSSGNLGVLVAAGGIITSAGSGSGATVTVRGTAGNTTGTGNIGVIVNATSSRITSSGGAILVEGTGTSTSPAIQVDFSGAITSGSNASITLVGDSMTLTSPGTVNAGAGTVTLRQRTNGTLINLGGNDVLTGSPLTLGLTDAELDTITAGTIQIGDSNSGAITVSAGITRASATNLSLTTGVDRNIAFSGAGALTSFGGNVTLTTSGSGAITSGTATTDISAGPGALSINAGSGGIGASGNALTLTSGNLSTATSGNANQFLGGTVSSVTIGAGSLNAGTGTIELASGTFTLGGSDRIANASDVVISGGATLALGANNDTVDQLVLVNGTVSGTTGTLTGTSVFDVRQGTISARIGGNVGLTKTSGNTVILSGSNTYTGDTLVSAGTLEHNNSNAVSAGTITLAGTNAALTIGTGFDGARPLVISDIGDAKSLNLAGPGSSYSGTITIEENTRGNFFIGRPSGTDGNIFSKLTGTGQAGVSLFGLGNTERGYNFWNGTSDYTGPILINRGLARALATNAMGLGTIEIASATSGGGLELGDGVDLANNIIVNAGTGGIALANGASSATVSGNIAANFAFGLGYINYFDSTDTLTVTGIISGSGLVSTEGAGTVVLTRNNSYTGGTNVRGAALRVNHSNALGTNTVTLAPGSNTTLTLADGVNVANALVISNTGDSKRITTVAGGAATYSGTIQIQETTVGNFAVRPPDAGSSLTLSGDISGTGGAGIGYGGAGGTVIVSGNNSYTGGTRIDIATVRAGHNNALSTSGTVTLQNTAILELVDGVSVARALSVSDTGGQKILRLHSTATSATYSGAVTIAETTQNNFDLSTSSGQTLALSGDIDGSGGAGIEKIGDGTVVLSGNNSYTGITNVTAGILRAANANALGSTAQGTVVPNGSQLELAGGVTVAGESLTISGSGTNFIGALQSQSGANTWSGSVLLGLDNTRIGANGVGQTLTVNGVIDDGAGTFNFAVRNADAGGTTVIGGANTYGGNTDVIVGTLRLATGSNRIPAGTTVRLGNGTNTGSATLDLNGQNQEVGAIVTVGTSMPMSVTNSGTSTLTYNLATDQSFSGAIEGGVSLFKTGAGTLTLTGANSYSGTTTISQGILDVDGTHTGGGTYGIAALATLRGSGSITANILGGPGSAIVSDGNFVIGNIASASGFETSGTVTIGAGNSLTVNDSDLAVLGTSTVVNGTLTKGGSQGFSLSAGETLSGHGTISGAVTTDTGTIAPGNSPGILGTGNLDLDGGTYNVELGGTTPGNLASNHDQIDVTGSVTLGAGTATLNISAINGFVPASTNSFVIIRNDGTDAVSGTFAGLAEGASFTSGGNTYTISYKGGDGNDVVLFGGASQTEISLSGSSLVIGDTNGGISNDRLTIRFDSNTNEYVISDESLVLTNAVSLPGSSFTRPDGNTLRIAAAGITDLVVNGLGGDDFLTIDVSTGALPVNVVFNGGLHATTNGDALRVVGSGTQSAVYTPHASIAGNGLITLGAQSVTFTGLEPVDFDTLLSVTVTLPGANDVLTVANGFDSATGLLPAMIVSGTSGGVGIEAAHIRNVGSVIIDTTANDGIDTINVTSASNAHLNGNLSILTGAGVTDRVNVNGAVSMGGNITITTRELRVNAGGHISSTGAGNISLTGNAPATAGIIVNSANITTTGAGTITLSGTGGDGNDESGLQIQNSAIATGTGNITMTGQAADLVNTEDGVNFSNVTVTTGGAISISGTGGNRGGESYGIEITGNSDLQAGTGITLAGTSGDGGVTFNVSAGAGYDIETTAGNVSITGTRSDDTGTSNIVHINNARVDTDGGSVSIVGTSTSPASTSTGWGVSLTNGSDLEAATGITVTGNTGGGGGVNFDVSGAGNEITTTGGDITITGTGTNLSGVVLNKGTTMAISTGGSSNILITGNSGSGDNQSGVSIGNAAVSTGTGNITVTGQAADLVNSEDGVNFNNVTVTTGGAISISGTGGDRSSESYGIEITGNSDLQAGTGITLAGTSGNSGVNFNVSAGAGYDIETTSGNVSITGTRTDATGSSNIVTVSNALVNTGGGSVSIVGTSSVAGLSGAYGVAITNASDIDATTGITLTGSHGSAGGVYFIVSGGGDITTTGGNILITGTGGDGNDESAVVIHNADVTTSGNITVTGQAGATTIEDGVNLSNVIVSTTGGSISISGTGGDRTGESYGVEIAGNSDLQAATGITLAGTSGDGGVNFNVSAGAGYDIETTAGNVSITGTRSDDTGTSNIVHINNARVDTDGGSVSIVGSSTSPASTSTGWGVSLTGESDLDATTGITVTGNTGGGGGVNFNVTGAGNEITTTGGDITITGTGTNLSGVVLTKATTMAISTGGSSNILITGNSGSGDNQSAVSISNAAVSTGTGNITVTGQAADLVNSEDGVNFSNVTVTTGGSISISGTGGNRGGESYGIEITGNSDLQAGTGITLAGTSGDGGVTFNVSSGAGYDIETTTGNVSITGTRTDATGSSNIVTVSNALVNTGGGSVSIVGTSSVAGFSGGYGVAITNASDIDATTGITLTGSHGNAGGVSFVVSGGGDITTTNGAILITGSGGDGDGESGVVIQNADVTTAGNITVTGQAGATTIEDGVNLFNVIVSTTGGAISISGTGGNRGGESYGIDITGNSDLSAFTGITLAGTSGDGGVNFSVNAGVGLYDIETGSGNLSITGTRSDDTGTLNIVNIVNARVDTDSGSVSIAGSSTSPASTSTGWGVSLTGESDLDATTGITLTGNTGGGGGVNFNVSGAGNEITTTGGDITITGTGTNLSGVVLSKGTTMAISTGGSSNITISGTGGDSDGEDGAEIWNAAISTGTGNITVTGQVGTTGGEDGIEMLSSSIATTGSGAVSITGTGGDRGDSQGVTIEGTSNITTANGNLSITGNAPNTGGTRTDLQIIGTATASSTGGIVTITGNEISLTSTAPKVVSALGNHLRVQPFTDAGTIGIGNGATGTLLANVAFLDKLAISDAHTLTIGRDTGTGAVDIRPLNRSAEGEDFHFIGGNINVNTLNVGTNNLTLTSTTGAITDASGTDITAANVTLNGTVTPGQSPGILVIAGNTTINNGVTFEFDGNAGAGLVNGHDRIDVTGTVTLNATTSTVTIDTTDLINTEIAAGDEIILINNDGADAITGTFSNAPLVRNLVNSNVAGTNLDLVLRYNGGTGNDVSFLVGNVTTRVFVDGSGNLVIEDVDDTTNDQITVQVVGTDLVITEADTNIFIDALGFTGDLTNQVTVPLASFTGNVILRLGGGDDAIVFNDVDLTGTRGLTVENGAGTDTVTFQTASSDLANGNVNVAADTINVNVALNAGTAGNITLNATTGNLALNANLATGGAGIIDLDAGGTITQAAATTIATGSGAITLDAAGNITLTGISTTGNITATSTGGSILDAGDVNTDLTAANVTLGGTAIGASGNAISTTTTTLTTNTSGAGGNQFLTETDTLTAINLAAGAGTITLATGGSITDTDGAADLTAASVVVTVTSGDFGAVGNAIGTTVASLSVNTAAGNGSQWISETDGLTALSLDAGNGNVTLSAGGVITDVDFVPLDVIATSLALTSAGFGTAGNLIATQVSSLEADGGAGGIFVGNNGDLVIGGVSGALSGLDTNSGGILIRTTGALTTSEAIDATGGEVRLVANSMALGSTVASSGGNLILAPFVGSTTIGVGGGSGTLNLDDAELALLTDGFSSITIGDASFGTGAVDVDSSSFTDNVTIVGGTVAVTDLTAGTNNATVIARTGAITDGGDAGTDVTAALVTLNSNGAIGASGDAISIAATSISTNSNLIAANGNQFLTTATSVAVTGFNAGTGTIEISGGEFDLTANNVVNDATIIAIETGTTLDADGTDTFAGVTVRSGGTLKGDGNLQTTPVTVLAGGTVTPGEGASGTGDLGTGTLTLNPSAVYSVNINGNTAVTQYDQLVVTGTVNLGNATLSLAPLGYVPTAGHTYTLISNDGVDPVVGIFAGLIEGSYVSASVINGTPPPAFLPDQLFQISYVGGDGNDVVLTAAAVIATTNIRIDGSGNLLVEDILGGSTADNLSISRVGSNFVIEDLSGNPLGTLIPGATQTTLSRVQVPVALVTTGGILVNTLAGADTINLDGFSGAASFGGYLIVNGGAGVDTINVNADLTTTGADGTNRSVDLQGDIILVDAGVDLVTSSAAGTVSLIANRNIFMDGNSRIQTVGGDITLSANLAGTETGNFVGIQLRGADLTSTTGNMSLTAQGGTTGNTNRGISIDFDTATSSTTEITTAGSVTLNGTGGAGGQQGTGVFIDRGTVQSTGAGPVTITGTGGAGTQSNDGIMIFSGFVDAGSGNLSLTGTGASTGSFNRGIGGFSSWLISAGGNVSVLGSGGGTALSAAYSLGVEVVDSVVGTFGTGTITLHGTGANGTQHNVGLKVHSTSVQGENGLIDLRGTGRGNNVSNVGLQILAGADVVSTGTGNINLDGTGSTTGTTSNHGVEIASDSVLRVANGNLTIDGTGNGTLQAGKGVVLSVSLLETTGSGDIFVNGTGSANTTLGTSRGIESVTGRIRSTGTGDITLIGTGGTGSSLNQGVVLASTTTISTASGDLTIRGNGGGAGATSGGVHVHASSNLSVGGSGNLTILGTGALGTNSNEGVQISSTSVVTTVNGALVVTGTGRGTGQLNSGVLLSNSTLSSTGTGNLIITGAGTSSAATGSNNKGITMSGGALNTVSGNLVLVGTGGRGVSTNEGIRIASAALRSTGGGSLSLTGAALGTTTGTQNTGVFLTSVTLDSSGAKTIIGTGGGGTATSANHGVYMQSIVVPLVPAPSVTGTKGAGSASLNRTGNFFP